MDSLVVVKQVNIVSKYEMWKLSTGQAQNKYNNLSLIYKSPPTHSPNIYIVNLNIPLERGHLSEQKGLP